MVTTIYCKDCEKKKKFSGKPRGKCYAECPYYRGYDIETKTHQCGLKPVTKSPYSNYCRTVKSRARKQAARQAKKQKEAGL